MRKQVPGKVMRGQRWEDVDFFIAKGGTEVVDLYVEGKDRITADGAAVYRSCIS